MYIFIAINLPLFPLIPAAKAYLTNPKAEHGLSRRRVYYCPKEAALGFYLSPCLKICCLAITLAYALFRDKK